MKKIDFSFVFPCLNEEDVLPLCIEELNSNLRNTGYKWEIIVADNGSSDRSPEIALSLGARLVHVARRGYGAALKEGILSAEGEYVAFADCDGSYCLEDTASLFSKAISEDADMAIASRLRGRIESGAMPFLHRHLGTPVLTALINILYGGHLSDCNSGFRCVRKSAFERWKIRSDGMEFASELLIKALKDKAKILEIVSGLRKDKRSREPHLRTWRDGMRHLLFIISEKPQAIEIPGLCLLAGTSFFQILALIVGPTILMGLNIFDYHTHAILLMLGIMGAQAYFLATSLFLQSEEKPLRLTQAIIHLDEAQLFAALILSGIACVLFVAWLFIVWASRNFYNLDMINPLLVFMHFISVVGFVSIGMLGIHILKRLK